MHAIARVRQGQGLVKYELQISETENESMVWTQVIIQLVNQVVLDATKCIIFLGTAHNGVKGRRGSRVGRYKQNSDERGIQEGN